MVAFYGARGGSMGPKEYGRLQRTIRAMRRERIQRELAARDPLDRCVEVLVTRGSKSGEVTYDDFRRVGLTAEQVDRLIDRARARAFRAEPALHAIQEMVSA